MEASGPAARLKLWRVRPTLVSTAGEHGRQVLEGFSDSLVLFW